MEDWESIDSASEPAPKPMLEQAKRVEEAEPVATCLDKESQEAAAGRQIRVQLPSGTSLDIYEQPRPGVSPTRSTPSTNVDSEVLDSRKLWRAINTTRRWNSTIQMLHNKLREAKRPTNVLRNAFIVAAEDFVLPGRLSQHKIMAEVTELTAAFRGLPEWAWLGPAVQRLQKLEKPNKNAQGAASPDTEALEQAKMALLFAVCCVYSPDKRDICADHNDGVVEAIPATFKLAVTSRATIAFASSLLAELVDEQSTGLLTSVGVKMDFTAAKHTHAALQARAKQSAREQQLFGRSNGTPTAPAPLTVPCTVTLEGPDYAALQRIGAKAAQTLRTEAAKRQHDDDSGYSSSKRRAGLAHRDVVGTDGCSAAALVDSLFASR